MGLGKRACKPTKVILEMDSSILEGSDYVAYLESGFDEKHLKLDPSDPPVRWTLRQWGDAHKDYIGAQDTARAIQKAGVRCSLLGHSGYTVTGDGGIEAPADPIERKPEGRLGEVVPLSWFVDVNPPDTHLEALYACARIVSEAPRPLSKRSEPGSGPPESGNGESTGE